MNESPTADKYFDLSRTSAGQFGRRKAMRRAAGTAVVAVVVGIVSWQLTSRSPDQPLRFAPLVNLPGGETAPAFSPAGDYVTFAYRPEGASDFDLYVKAVGGGGPLQLTSTPEGERYPQWSPDSSQIAFLRRSRSAMSISVIGATGGGDRKMADVRWLPTDGETTLAWSKNGDDLIFPDRNSDFEPLSLYSFHLSTGVRSRLTYLPPGTVVIRAQCSLLTAE